MLFDEESEEFDDVMFLSFLKRKYIWLNVRGFSVLKECFFLSVWKFKRLESGVFNFCFDDDEFLVIVLEVCKVVKCNKKFLLRYFKFMKD